jgi:hypothetical protein
MACLSNAGFTTLTWDIIYSWYPQSQVILDQPKKTREVNQLDTVLGQQPAKVVKG